MIIFCCKCKRKTETRDVEDKEVNGRQMVQGHCVNCDGKKSQFTGRKSGKGPVIKPMPAKPVKAVKSAEKVVLGGGSDSWATADAKIDKLCKQGRKMLGKTI